MVSWQAIAWCLRRSSLVINGDPTFSIPTRQYSDARAAATSILDKQVSNLDQEVSGSRAHSVVQGGATTYRTYIEGGAITYVERRWCHCSFCTFHKWELNLGQHDIHLKQTIRAGLCAYICGDDDVIEHDATWANLAG